MQTMSDFEDPHFCRICNIELTSEVVATQHYIGKKHLKQLKALSSFPQPVTSSLQPQESSSDHMPSDVNEYFNVLSGRGECYVCKVEFTSAEMREIHLSGRKHLKKCSLLSDPPVNNGKSDTCCDLCEAPFTGPESAAQHYKSAKHLQKELIHQKNTVPGYSSPEPSHQQASSYVHDASFDSSSSSRLEKGTQPTGNQEFSFNPMSDRGVCHVCNVDFTSSALKDQHLSGRNHQKKLLRWKYMTRNEALELTPQTGTETNSPLPPDAIRTVGGSDSSRSSSIDLGRDTHSQSNQEFEFDQLSNRGYCLVCNVDFTSVENKNQHLSGKNHAKKLARWRFQNKSPNTDKPDTPEVWQPTCRFEAGFDQQQQPLHPDNSNLGTAPLQRPASNFSETTERSNIGSSVETFKCLVCNISCSSEDNLLDHQRGKPHMKKVNDNSGGEFYCQLCNVTCSSADNLLDHKDGKSHLKLANDSPVNPFFCELCNISCTSYEGLQDHEKGKQHCRKLLLHSDISDTFFCDVCKIKCSSQENLEDHRRGKSHRKVNASIHGIRGASVGSSENMIGSSVPKKESYTCERCSVSFGSIRDIVAHDLETHHLKTFECAESCEPDTDLVSDAKNSSAIAELYTWRKDTNARSEENGQKCVLPRGIETDDSTSSVSKRSCNDKPTCSAEAAVGGVLHGETEQKMVSEESNGSFDKAPEDQGTTCKQHSVDKVIDVCNETDQKAGMIVPIVLEETVTEDQSCQHHFEDVKCEKKVNEELCNAEPSFETKSGKSITSSPNSNKGEGSVACPPSVYVEVEKHGSDGDTELEEVGSSSGINEQYVADDTADVNNHQLATDKMEDKKTVPDLSVVEEVSSHLDNLSLSDVQCSDVEEAGAEVVGIGARSEQPDAAQSLNSDCNDHSQDRSNTSGECLASTFEQASSAPSMDSDQYVNTTQSDDTIIPDGSSSLTTTLPTHKLSAVVRDRPCEDAFDLVKTFPRCYQVDIVEKTSVEDCVVFLPEGLGKALTAIMTASHMLTTNASRPVLFIVDGASAFLKYVKAIRHEIGNKEFERMDSGGVTVMRKLLIAALCIGARTCTIDDLSQQDIIVTTPGFLFQAIEENRLHWTIFSMVVSTNGETCLGKPLHRRVFEKLHSTLAADERPKILVLASTSLSFDTPEKAEENLKGLTQLYANCSLISADYQQKELTRFLNAKKMEIVSVPLNDDEMKLEETLTEYISSCFQVLNESVGLEMSSFATDTILSCLQILKDGDFESCIGCLSDLYQHHLQHCVDIINTLYMLRSCGIVETLESLGGLFADETTDALSVADGNGPDLRSIKSFMGGLQEKYIGDTQTTEILKKVIELVTSTVPIGVEGNGTRSSVLILVRLPHIAAKLEQVLMATSEFQERGLECMNFVKMQSVDSEETKLLMADVRSGKYKIGIATHVCDYGVDMLPKCELIVQLDPRSCNIAIGQTRGRECFKDSKVIAVCRGIDQRRYVEGLWKCESNGIEAASQILSIK